MHTDSARKAASDGYPDSLALCIIDAIYSSGARHAGVEKIVSRYRGYRLGQGGDPETDGVTHLLATIHELDGPELWATRIGNRRPTSTSPGAPLRSVAVMQVAEALDALDIRTTSELRAVMADEHLHEGARQAWCSVPGQRSGVSWNAVLRLCSARQQQDAAYE